MNYRRFELLITSLGLAMIFATIIASIFQRAGYEEILGQALFAPVLFGALHYGRRVGFLAAMLAAIVFIVARFYNQNAEAATFVPEFIIARTALYGMVGIIGGDLALKMKYMLTRIEDASLIDPQTNLFSRDYIAKLIDRNLQGYDRYHRAFSVAMVTIKHRRSEIFDWPQKKKVVIKAAMSIRNGVRIVDDVGHWSYGNFCIIMPDTTLMDGKIAVNRIYNIIIKELNQGTGSNGTVFDFETQVISCPEDREELNSLIHERQSLKDQSPTAVLSFGSRLKDSEA